MFSNLREACRANLDEVTKRAGGGAVRKSTFLATYQKARTNAFLSGKIVSGWRHTGLWPASVKKALQSKHVINYYESSAASDRSGINRQTAPPYAEHWGCFEFCYGNIKRSLTTPSVTVMPEIEFISTPGRCILPKGSERLKEQNMKTELQQQEIEHLQLQSETLEPPKRQRVHRNANQRFFEMTRNQGVVGQNQAVEHPESVAGPENETI